MKIRLNNIPIKDVVKGYKDNDENGVIGYGGKLNIRPAYQREFIYPDLKRNMVIDTVRKNFPLNVMYWVKSGENSYEMLDGQQRTISICQYINGDFSHSFEGKLQYFHGLTETEKEQILNYELMIYICEGNDKEKLDWFKTINIAGEKLYDQELRNAIYTGPWLSDAKRHFSKNNCAAYGLASKYLSGSAIRQDYLQTAIKWISDISDETIEEYMSRNQNRPNANELWLYFQSVVSWVKVIFPKYRNEMKGIEWGILYNKYKDESYDSEEFEKNVIRLMQDEDVTKKKGIYEYLLDGKEKHLNIRAFSDNMKRQAYERQKGICANCGEKFDIKEMEADHITPWHEGGKTVSENCQMLCKECNRRKSGK